MGERAEFQSFDPAKMVTDRGHRLYTTQPDRLRVAARTEIGWRIMFLTPAEIRQQEPQGIEVRYPVEDAGE